MDYNETDSDDDDDIDDYNYNSNTKYNNWNGQNLNTVPQIPYLKF